MIYIMFSGSFVLKQVANSGTCKLTLLEWVKLLVLASMPLFAHELLVFGSCLEEKEVKKNANNGAGEMAASGGRWS